MASGMSSKRNGWKRIALAATTIVALGGAVAVLEPYTPWAPRITFAIAAENKLARLDNRLFTLTELQEQARARGDAAAGRRLLKQIKAVEREIEKLMKLMDKHG